MHHILNSLVHSIQEVSGLWDRYDVATDDTQFLKSRLYVYRYLDSCKLTSIKILGGYVFDEFLSPRTLLIKSLCLALSVASGLSLGKEGPLVHVSCCMAYLISRLFTQFRQSEGTSKPALRSYRYLSLTCRKPRNGRFLLPPRRQVCLLHSAVHWEASFLGLKVLFYPIMLEYCSRFFSELDTFAGETDVMWRAFVASAVAAVGLQWVNPFGTSKLVLFEVSRYSDTWLAFELIPWALLGVIGVSPASLYF